MKKETVSIQRRLGERIQLQTTTNGDNGPRRVIKSKRYRCRRKEQASLEILYIFVTRQTLHKCNSYYLYPSQYSEDEVSDLSLDELTDEEPEDLRATLNKNKHLIRVSLFQFPGYLFTIHFLQISKPNSAATSKKSSDIAGRLIRKVDNTNPVKKVSSPVKDKTGSRVIRMKKEENKNDSRPSSSEWIERTISGKFSKNISFKTR